MNDSTRGRRLTKSRNDFYTHSDRKHISIEDLPVEILSLIFEKVTPCDSDLDEVYEYRGDASDCLRQAVILSSVSSHLRRAAFGTPELWKRLPLTMDQPIDALVPLLHHCASHAFFLHISIKRDQDRSNAEVPSNVKILLSSEVSQKLEFLDLHASCVPQLWIPFLTSFPILKTLIISTELADLRDDSGYMRFDLGALSRLTQIHIEGMLMESVVLPPSVQVLRLVNVPQDVQVSLLPQCPNLVTCTNLIEMDYVYGHPENSYTKPVILNYLKRLIWPIDSGFESAASVRNVQMPVLEYLGLFSYQDTPTAPAAVISVCQQVSTTLKTFHLNVKESDDVWQYNDFYRLFRLPLHNLTTLEIDFIYRDLEAIIRALTPNSDGCNTSENNYLPSLKSLALESISVYPFEKYGDGLPRLLLELLKKWRIGETSYFYFKLNTMARVSLAASWPPELQRELRAIKRGRQIDLRIT